MTLTSRPMMRACGAYETQAGDGTSTSASHTTWSRNMSSFDPGPMITSSGTAGTPVRRWW
jgi:hypothetical protein